MALWQKIAAIPFILLGFIVGFILGFLRLAIAALVEGFHYGFDI